MEEARTSLRPALPRKHPVKKDPGNHQTRWGGYGPLPWNYWSKKIMNNLLKGESGASALEYALLVALIAIVIISGIRTLGTAVNACFLSAVAMFP